MKCPCCGALTPDRIINDKLWSLNDFTIFISGFCKEEYNRIKKYDLEHYFFKVKNTYDDLDSWDKILKAMSRFIANDEGSNGKFQPKMAKVEKIDIVSVAYALVKSKEHLIRDLKTKDVYELSDCIKKVFRDMPEWNNPLFEGYIEKALKYYKLAE